MHIDLNRHPEDNGRANLRQRAKHLWKEGRHEESNEVYFSLLENKELVKDLYEVYTDIADNYVYLDQHQDSKNWLGKCLELPESPNRLARAHVQIAVSESYLGDGEAERQHCLAALGLFDRKSKDYDPQSECHMYDMLGKLSLHDGEAATAEKYLKEAIAIHDGNLKTWREWGVPHSPVYAWTLEKLADALLRQKKFDDSLRVAKRAVKCQERTKDLNFLLYGLLGHAYYVGKHFAKAASCLEEALKNAEDRSQAAEQFYLLGHSYHSLGDHDKALDNYLAALNGEIRFAEGPVERAVIYRYIAIQMYFLGRSKEGDEWYQKARTERGDPTAQREAMVWQAFGLARGGQAERAVDLLQEYAEGCEDEVEKAETHYDIAVIFWNAGKMRMCKEWLEKSIALHPTKDAKRFLRRVMRLLKSQE